MTTKHMPPTPAEVLEDTEMLFMVTMMVLTAGPNARAYDPIKDKGWKDIHEACVHNDRRWMTPGYPIGPLRTLDPDHWRKLTRECTFDI